MTLKPSAPAVLSDAGFDFHSASAKAQLAFLAGCTPQTLRDLARGYDWSRHPQRVLGWIMAQKTMDLGTALEVFLKGEPHRFNYVPKRDIPAEFRGATLVLDTICLRLNSGFYLALEGQDLSQPARILRWLEVQAMDRSEGRQGRYVLDERLVKGFLNTNKDEAAKTLAPCAAPEPANAPLSFLRGLFRPSTGKTQPRRGSLFGGLDKTTTDDLNNLHY